MNGAAWLVAACCVGLAAPQSPPSPVSPELLFSEFKAICLDWDGDPEAAAEIAGDLGYSPSQELVPDDLFQGQGLVVFSKTEDGVDWRVVTRAGFIGGDGVRALHHRCYVSADPGEFRPMRETARRHFGFGWFQQRDTSVFAWIPGPDGQREPVRRGRFENGLLRLSRREGLRFVTVARHNNQVILAYIVPR